MARYKKIPGCFEFEHSVGKQRGILLHILVIAFRQWDDFDRYQLILDLYLNNETKKNKGLFFCTCQIFLLMRTRGVKGLTALFGMN